MPSYLPRGELTDYLIVTLETAGLLVGDGKAPDEGGWDDDPNKPSSGYVPYVVINPMAVPDPTGTLGDSAADYRAPYSFTSWGITRAHVESYSDLTRKTVAALERAVIQLDGSDWKIQQARANSIGGVARADNTEPSEFSQADVVTVWITKETS